MRCKYLLFLLPAFLAFNGCNVINPPEKTPTYIKIDSFQLKIDNPNSQGSAAAHITSVWVYYNNAPVGIFDLPCQVPVITEGNEGRLSVAPAITLNGLSDLQPIYPFYSFDTSILKSNPGKVVTINPVTLYWTTAKFPFLEDFEVGNSFGAFYPDIANDTTIRRTEDQTYIFEGGGSGLIELSDAFPTSESISNTGFAIPQGEAFIEINYKCSVPFEIGLYNTLNTSNVDVFEYIMGIKATDTWKKIYIELGTFTGNNPGTNHKVLIKSVLPEGQSSGYVAIDNIKIVTF